MRFLIKRADLVRIVEKAAQDINPRTRDRLIAVARTTDAVAAGWWHCDGAGCPAQQAHVRNQCFQERYDRAMAEYFGRIPDARSFRADVDDDES